MKIMSPLVEILGTEYSVNFKNYDSEPEFKEKGIAGFCDFYRKEIVICRMESHPDFKNADIDTFSHVNSHNLRHEIVHAFLDESGLSVESFSYEDGWAMNEEMVDWFAIQGPKIYKAWKDVGAV